MALPLCLCKYTQDLRAALPPPVHSGLSQTSGMDKNVSEEKYALQVLSLRFRAHISASLLDISS